MPSLNYINRFTANLLFKKVKGGALYIAILVSCVVGIILSMFLLLSNFNQRNVSSFVQSAQLYYNLQSALQVAQSHYFTKELNNTWIKNNTNDDSIRVTKKSWGAYIVITCETKNRHQRLSQSGFYGTYMTADTGIMVPDQSRPLGIGGKVVFKAPCYLPASGIKPAYIEGQSYVSTSANLRFIRSSPSFLPLMSSDFIRDLKAGQELVPSEKDSTVNLLPEVFDRSFTLSTVLYRVPFKLTGINMRNNIKLICKEIEIDTTCHLENILIICSKVRFKEGFRGKVHVLASDSIVCEKNCEFEYPSSFVLLPKEEASSLNYIQLSEGVKFTGGMIAYNTSKEKTSAQKVFIKLHAKSEVNGFIYSSDYIHAEGNINATAICNKLLLKTSSAVYENHLLGCEIDPKKYEHLLAIPMAFNRSKFLCAEKIN